MNDPAMKEEKKSVLNLYALLGVSLILSILPSMPAAVLSLLFFLGLLITAYKVRKKAEDKSYEENHATFIIRTLWIGAFLSLITMAAATVYMMANIDYSLFNPCTDSLVNKGAEWLESASFSDVYPLVQPCIEGFVHANRTLLMNCVLIAGGPVIAYMGYRLLKGVVRAKEGYRIANEKGWF